MQVDKLVQPLVYSVRTRTETVKVTKLIIIIVLSNRLFFIRLTCHLVLFVNHLMKMKKKKK